MRTVYYPESRDFWTKHYLAQGQHGYGLAAFSGVPFQRGTGIGSFFKGLFRSIFPLAKSIGKVAAKQALSSGTSIASDYLAGKDLKQSVKRRAREAVGDTLAKSAKIISQGGQGRRRPGCKPQCGRGVGSRKSAKSIKGVRKTNTDKDIFERKRR